MNLDEYTKEKLWQLLVEAVHSSVVCRGAKSSGPGRRDGPRKRLPQKGDISAAELAERLGMPFGEALVILNELIQDQKV